MPPFQVLEMGWCVSSVLWMQPEGQDLLRRLLLPLHQIRHLHSQHQGQCLNHTESRVSLPPFDTPDVGQVEAALVW